MILASGLLACFIYCFAIGNLWPGSSGYGRWLEWASTIAKALWISWFVAVISFLFRVNNPLPICFLLILSSGLIRLLNPSNKSIPCYLQGSKKYLLDFLVLIALSWISYTALSRIPTSFGLFTEWDAVVSWNRWAVEWSNNTYEPAKAAYPILFPGIWSLIYRAQETSEIWFVAKLSMYLVPVLCILILASLAEQGLIATACFATVGFILMVFNFGEATVSGYMDAPVALMMLASGLWMIFITARPSSSHCLWPLSALVGVTAITKQAGLLIIIPYLVILFSNVQMSKMPWRLALTHLAIVLIPITTFLSIYLTREISPIGNLNLLTNFAANSAGHESKLLNAFDLLFREWEWLLLLPFCGLLSLSNITVKNQTSLLGSIFLLLAICFFPIFANCCSYDVRNGWWLVSLILLAGVCGVVGFDLKNKRKCTPSSRLLLRLKSSLIVSLVAAVFIICAGWWMPNQRLLALQKDLQWNVGYPSISALLRKHSDMISSDTKLITTYMPSRWLPGLNDSYVWCQNRRNDVAQCVKGQLENHRSLILKRETDYQFLERSFLDNYLLDEVDGFQLYGPFQLSSKIQISF